MDGVHRQPEALEGGGVGRARALTLRHLAESAIALALAGCVAAAVVMTTSASRVGHRRNSRHLLASSLVVGLPVPAVRSWGLETAEQVAAVRRLAGYGLPLFCAGGSKRMVALTFDDGPGVYTHLAIKKLRGYHMEATFFLVGKEIHAWPGWAQREKRYAVFGDHTMTHPFLPALPKPPMLQQIVGAKALIERTVGEPVVLFRPPYGGRTPAIQHEVTSLGMLMVLWNVDSADSLGANYARIEQNVIAGLRPGSIILMHENRGQTIRALPTIFAALSRRHLQAVTVPQLVAEDPPSLAQLRAGGAGCGVRRQVGNGG
jgi:peptidoglycan/xylan/chitin deacetylase (PgdA/CDA1 family)